MTNGTRARHSRPHTEAVWGGFDPVTECLVLETASALSESIPRIYSCLIIPSEITVGGKLQSPMKPTTIAVGVVCVAWIESIVFSIAGSLPSTDRRASRQMTLVA